MFELVVTICLSITHGGECHREISPKAASLDTCEIAGAFIEQKLRWALIQHGKSGQIAWTCRKRITDL